MRILLIRHADPDYSIDSLTPKGHAEAKALADFLVREPLAGLFTSPLGRARATAAYTEAATGLTAGVEPWTREMNRLHAPARDLMCWDIPGHILRKLPADAVTAEPHATEVFEGRPIREETEALAAASDEFLERLGYRREGHVYKVLRRNTDTYALFCHGGFGLTWLAHLLQIPLHGVWSGFFLHPSSITTLLWDEREAGIACPRCIGAGALPHLAVAGLAPTPSGIKANYA
jgi:broad specificity phosphatase PhoE